MSAPSLLRRRALSLLATAVTAAGLVTLPAVPSHASDPATTELAITVFPGDEITVPSDTNANDPATTDDDLLLVGALPGGSRNRAYLRFGTAMLPPGVVTSATLRFSNLTAPTCGSQPGEGIEARRLTGPYDPAFLHWGNKPDSTPDGAHLAAVECGVHAESVEWQLKDIVQDWVDGAPNHGIVLQHPDESLDDGYSLLTPMANYGFPQPRIEITMTITSAPEVRTVVLTPSYQAPDGTMMLLRTAPRFLLKMSDRFGGTMKGEYEIEHDPAAGQIWTGFSGTTRSGGLIHTNVPPGLIQDGWQIRWRARAHNLTAGTVSGWTPWQVQVVHLAPPEIASPEILPALQTGGTTVVSSLTPQLRAVVTHPYEDLETVRFEVEHDPDVPEQGTGLIWTGGFGPGYLAGGLRTVTVPAGKLSDGWQIRWRVRATSSVDVPASTDWQKATVALNP
ncbi:DNRLRE domain-containing protein [Herbidospora sp. RD11066]